MKKLSLLFLALIISQLAFSQATNDDCASAETITVSTTESTVNFEMTEATINNEVGCDGTTDDYADIWYDFTMPVNGNLFIGNTGSWNHFALYDTCGGTQLQCGNREQTFTNLDAETNYKLRIFRSVSTANNDDFTTFTIQAFEEVANDDCDSSQNISVTTTELTTINFSTGGATINNETGCDETTSNYADVWFDFTMPVNGKLFINGTVTWNNLALYDSCNGTLIACESNESTVSIPNLTAATNYKLRIFRNENHSSSESYAYFRIQAHESVANDECASSENISISTEDTTIVHGIKGADVNNETGCDGTIDNYLDVWYDFDMPFDGNIHIQGYADYNYFALYNACDGTLIQCESGNSLFTDLTAATNYKLRVFRLESDINYSFTRFKIQAMEPINNDDCSIAEDIAVTNTPTTVNFAIEGANINNEVGCSETEAEDYLDVWYSFTMPSDDDIVIDGDTSYNNFAIYDACDGNQIDCFSNQGTVTGLTSGTTYYIRVFRTTNLASIDNFRSFTIQTEETLSTGINTREHNVNVFPNPTKAQVTFSAPDSIKQIEIFTIGGRKTLTSTNTTINISHLPSGLYLAKITTPNDRTAFKKIIKN